MTNHNKSLLQNPVLVAVKLYNWQTVEFPAWEKQKGGCYLPVLLSW